MIIIFEQYEDRTTVTLKRTDFSKFTARKSPSLVLILEFEIIIINGLYWLCSITEHFSHCRRQSKKISRDLQICSAKHFLLSVRNLHNKYKVQISIGMYTFSFKQFLQISLLLLRF